MKAVFLFILNILYVKSYCEDFCENSSCQELNGNFFSECKDCGPTYLCNFGKENINMSFPSYYNFTI
mgnify:CR=1 FL=1